MVQYNSLIFFFLHRKSRMICNMKTSTIALLRMSMKKKKRQKTRSNQQQAKSTKKTCQTCDPLTETQPSDQKCHQLSKHVFFFA